jgi:hypothetical protein
LPAGNRRRGRARKLDNATAPPIACRRAKVIGCMGAGTHGFVAQQSAQLALRLPNLRFRVLKTANRIQWLSARSLKLVSLPNATVFPNLSHRPAWYGKGARWLQKRGTKNSLPDPQLVRPVSPSRRSNFPGQNLGNFRQRSDDFCRFAKGLHRLEQAY